MPPDLTTTANGPTPEARRRLRYRLRLALLIAAAIGFGYLCQWGLQRFHLKRFEVVADGVLYRSAQPTGRGFEQLLARYDIKTVVSTRREDAPLRRGLLDLGEPSGPLEAEFVAALGRTHLHWPMGGEAYWPWFGPQQFEDFFRLMDDPARWPIAVHCIGGRHRTGTFVALYRLEYDRWDVERALREMYAFEFGHPIPVQEHNLRTYFPRPRPNAEQWSALHKAWAVPLDHPKDYHTLVLRLRQARRSPQIEAVLAGYLKDGWPFALSLAHRVVDSADDPLAALVGRRALACLNQDESSPQDWAIAAALIADFGDHRQQQVLLRLLENGRGTKVPSARYQAAVRGVTNRFAPNRIAFLRPLLHDTRPRPEPQAVYQVGESQRRYRYCDTAVARLCTIMDCFGVVSPEQWENSRRQFLGWYDEHPDGTKLVRFGQSPVELPSSPQRTAMEDRDDYRR